MVAYLVDREHDLEVVAQELRLCHPNQVLYQTSVVCLKGKNYDGTHGTASNA